MVFRLPWRHSIAFEHCVLRCVNVASSVMIFMIPKIQNPSARAGNSNIIERAREV